MYMSEKPQQQQQQASSPLDFYSTTNGKSDAHPHRHQHTDMIMLSDGAAAGSDDANPTSSNPPSSSAPKKRAETWVQEETRALISLRKEIDMLFNTSKSNKHLWDNISLKMREKGFDRSPTMCTDKWRNLLKEYKKAKPNSESGNGNGNAKMSYYKEIDEILKLRGKSNNGVAWNTSEGANSGGIDDASLTFGPLEANGRSTLNLERRLDHDGHPLAITAADAVGASGASPWNWRGTPGSGEQTNTFDGRVITVKLGDYTKRIGIDGSADAIKETIKSAFRLRTKRAFWLEDEEGVVRTLDRDMPLGNYTLHIDEGVAIKICFYGEVEQVAVHTEDKTFYTDEDFRDFLARRGWTCLREFSGYRNVDTLDELFPGRMYRGVN